MTEFANWGDYWWPGQYEECLRNILHLSEPDGREVHDPDELEQKERSWVAVRSAELERNPDLVQRTYDFDHLRAIHGQLLGDVYEWAGQPRVVTTLKGESQFVSPDDIEPLARVVFADLGDPARFRGRPKAELVDQMTKTLQSMSMLHPFLEGNGRSQRVFMQHVAAASGRTIDWSMVTSAEQNATMIASFKLDPEPLRRMLTKIVKDPARPSREANSAAVVAARSNPAARTATSPTRITGSRPYAGYRSPDTASGLSR
jgi:cell filamentation protein